MQTLDFTRTLTDIVAELKVRELYLLLQALLVTVPPQLYSPGRLNRMMQLINNSQQIGQLRIASNPNSTEVFDFYQTLGALLKVEKTCRMLLQDEKIGKVEPNDSLLELQLTDYDEGGVAPARVAAAFSTLAKLQMNMARLLGAADNRLMVKYLDSGSDFKFGVEGLKDPIDAVRDLIHSIWDRIKHRDQDTFERNMQAITAGLDLLEKAKQAVESKAVTQEEADILKELVLREANDLIGLGVSPPLKGPAADEERKRLISKRSTKLLTTGDGPPVPPAEPAVDPVPQRQAD